MNLGYSENFPWGGETNFESKVLSGEKIRTIRLNEKGRWRAGILLNHLLGNRTKRRREFLRNNCISTENITIAFSATGKIKSVMVEGKNITNWCNIALNDGLTVNDFEMWFYRSAAAGVFKGTIVHWTNKKYAA